MKKYLISGLVEEYWKTKELIEEYWKSKILEKTLPI